MNPRPLPAALLDTIIRQTSKPVPDGLQPLVAAIRKRFGASVCAILFYGSCLRSGNPADGLVDLYILVDSYHQVHHSRLMQLANAWLPPNVYLLQALTPEGQKLQAKCALLTLDDFERGTARWFQSYLWGRFAQPARLVYSLNSQIGQRVHQAQARAVLRLLKKTLPCMPATFTTDELWLTALSLSYGTELRPESASRPKLLLEYDRDYYHQLFSGAYSQIEHLEYAAGSTGRHHNQLSAAACRQGQWEWKLRRVQGRLLNVLRLVKSVFTFENGADYVAWKLERHTGQPLEVTPRLRRYPLIFGWPVLWRLLKEKRLR